VRQCAYVDTRFRVRILAVARGPCAAVCWALVVCGTTALGLSVALAAAPGRAQDDPTVAPTRDLKQVEQRMQILRADLAARQKERESIGTIWSAVTATSRTWPAQGASWG